MPTLTLEALLLNRILLTKRKAPVKERLPPYAPIAAARLHGVERTRPLAGWCAMPAWEMLNIEKNLLMMYRQAHIQAATNLNLQVQETSTFASGSSICSYRY